MHGNNPNPGVQDVEGCSAFGGEIPLVVIATVYDCVLLKGEISELLTQKREEIASSDTLVFPPFCEQAAAVYLLIKSKEYLNIAHERIEQLSSCAATLLMYANLLTFDQNEIDSLAKICIAPLYGWVLENREISSEESSSDEEPSGQVDEAEASGPVSKRARRS